MTTEHMHARSHASGAALCGATGKFAWSLDPDAVTCSKCRATLLMLGEPLRWKREEPLITPICVRIADADDATAPQVGKAVRPGASTRRPGAPARRARKTASRTRKASPRTRKASPRPKKRR